MSSCGSLQWLEVNSKSKLSKTQREYLRLVANLHNTRFWSTCFFTCWRWLSTSPVQQFWRRCAVDKDAGRMKAGSGVDVRLDLPLSPDDRVQQRELIAIFQNLWAPPLLLPGWPEQRHSGYLLFLPCCFQTESEIKQQEHGTDFDSHWICVPWWGQHQLLLASSNDLV